MDSTNFKIGYIAKTHGLKGGVSVILNADAPPLESLSSVFIEIRSELVPHLIDGFSDRSDKAFVRFKDVTTPEAAHQLKGCSLYIPRSERAKLARGEFYDDEVVGFEVEDVHLGVLGDIREVAQMGPNRLLVVDHNGKEVLIPVNGPFITSFVKSKKKFTVDLPDGFLDI